MTCKDLGIALMHDSRDERVRGVDKRLLWNRQSSLARETVTLARRIHSDNGWPRA